ncbi:MAG TPA: BolA family protein [Gammaproteobacteria bacterium]
MDRSAAIRERLQQRFAPLELMVRDDGHLHIGHANEGRGHFAVRVVSAAFAEHDRVERHRMVYAALGDMMQKDIHAINITALTPDEIDQPKTS